MSETKKTSTVTKSTKAVSPPETVMYVGPNIKGVVVKGTLYKNGKLPALLKKEIEKFPVLKSLLVPVSELSVARKDLQNPKSAIGTCYVNAVKELEKEG